MRLIKPVCSHGYGTTLCGVLVGVMLSIPRVSAADTDPNPGAITFTGGLEVPQVYFMRGIRQEVDPNFPTLFPYGDIGIAVKSDGTGGLKSAAINFGVWNSLNTGTSGSGGPTGLLHYEEDFYSALTLGFGGGVGVTTTFTAYTSPNNTYTTVKELMFKVIKTHSLNPYGMAAVEVGGAASGQADGGQLVDGKKGVYVEFGIGPSWPISKATLTVPVKIGLSAKDYYESPIDGKDNKFGYLDGGVLVTYPMAKVPGRFGSWNLHGGVDGLLLGETTKAFNVRDKGNGDPSKGQVIASGGIGVTY